jgi:hypothetical protein
MQNNEIKHLPSFKESQKIKIKARDGFIGYLNDFYFEMDSWFIRYLEILNNKNLANRKILISPYSLYKPEFENKECYANISNIEIKNCPPIDNDITVSRHQELNLADHYGWPKYWEEYEIINNVNSTKTKTNVFVYSLKQLISFTAQTLDGKKNLINDCLINYEAWQIPFMLINLKQNNGQNYTARVSLQLVTSIDFCKKDVFINLKQNKLKKCPTYP